MKQHISNAFYVLLAFLPSSAKRFIYNNILGHDIHPTAKIGLSFVKVQKLKMGPNARIRNFNIIRNLEVLELGESASIGGRNYISALPIGSKKHFLNEKDRKQALILEAHSSIVSNHFFDCNNTISIGHHTTIAGHGTSFFTHGIDIEENLQKSAPISIGNYCMVGACSVIIKGAVLPDCSILAANSTLHKAYETTHMLYSGVPAKAIKELAPESLYFHRTTGSIA